MGEEDSCEHYGFQVNLLKYAMWKFAYLCVLVCNVNPVVRCRNPSLRSSLSSTVPSLTINFSAPVSRARMTSALAERNFCPGWRGKRHNVPGLYEWPGRVELTEAAAAPTSSARASSMSQFDITYSGNTHRTMEAWQHDCCFK